MLIKSLQLQKYSFLVLGNFKKKIRKKLQFFNLILDLFNFIYFLIVLEHQLAKLCWVILSEYVKFMCPYNF